MKDFELSKCLTYETIGRLFVSKETCHDLGDALTEYINNFIATFEGIEGTNIRDEIKLKIVNGDLVQFGTEYGLQFVDCDKKSNNTHYKPNHVCFKLRKAVHDYNIVPVT